MMTTKRRNPLLAAVLSVLMPGMGQVYNGQAGKGIIFLIVFIGSVILLGLSGIAETFKGLLVVLVIEIFLWLFILGDSILAAIRRRETPLRAYNKTIVYLALIILWAGLNLGFQNKLLKRIIGLEGFRTPAASMAPTLVPGDHFYIDKSYYGKHPLQRGEIVAFPMPIQKNPMSVKRVVALGGDGVEIQNGRLILNGKPVPEPYLLEEGGAAGVPGGTSAFLVPAGKVFLLGDNRAHSSDSREWGFVDENSILGKALYIYWSADRSRIGREIR